MNVDTLIIQSHRDDRPAWIDRCLDSVRTWAETSGHAYRFVGDEMMAAIPADWRRATGRYPQIAADLGRLYLLRDALAQGVRQAVWLDADVLVFAPDKFDPCPETPHAFGREIWIEDDGVGGYRARRNVHNATLAFRANEPVLGFYIHACERILGRIAADGSGSSVPAQILGPKLLGALHNLVGFPLIDDVAMTSPPVIRDLADLGDGRALACLRAASDVAAAAANLSASVLDGEDDAVARAIDRLLAEPDALAPSRHERRAS